MKKVIILFVSFIVLSCSQKPFKSFDGYLIDARLIVNSKAPILSKLLHMNYFNIDSLYRITSIEIFPKPMDTICSFKIQRKDAPEGIMFDFNYSKFIQRISGFNSILTTRYDLNNVDSLLNTLVQKDLI